MSQIVIPAAPQAVVLIQHIDQLRERRGHIHTLFILDALQTLAENLFNDHCVFFNVRILVTQMQEQGHKRRLAVSGHQGIDLVLDGLDAGLQFFPQPFVHNCVKYFRICLFTQGLLGPFHKLFPAAAQIFAQMPHVHGLTAVLTGSYGSDNLGHHVAGYLKALGRFNHLAVHHGAVVQHVADIDQTAVENGLDKIIHIMKMDGGFVVGFCNLFRQNHAAGQIFGNLAGDQVALGRGHNGIFIAVFFHNVFIAVTNQGEDGFVGGIGLTH